MREIIGITSHPTVKSHADETVKTFKEILKLNVDTMYATHYKKVPKFIQDNATHIYVDNYNPIIGFNTPKKYNFLCIPQNEQWFTKGEVCPSNAFAHYLNLKNSIQISRMLGYDVYYAVVHDISFFFHEKNFDRCFYPFREHIANHDIVTTSMMFPIDVIENDNKKTITKLIFDTKLFAINLRSKLVDTFFNINTLEEYSKLHNKWQYLPIQPEQIKLRLYPCTFLEALLTLESKNYKFKILSDQIGNGSCGFFSAVMGIDPKEKNLKTPKEIAEFQNIDKWREKLGVTVLD